MFIPLHDTNPLQNIRYHYVTISIIIINTLIWVFLGTPAISSPELAKSASISFGFIPSIANDLRIMPAQYIVLPDWTSYLTYAFLHADFMHLAGNMLFIWVFGDNVEDAMGHWKFLAFYLACAAGGAFIHGLVLPASDSPLIGASGAAAGIVGAYLMLHPHVKIWVLALGRIPLKLKAYWVLGAWIAYQVGMFLFSTGSQVSWAAHVGGIVTGVILVIFLRKQGVPLFDKEIVEGAEVVAPVSAEIPVEQENHPKTPWGRNR